MSKIGQYNCTECGKYVEGIKIEIKIKNETTDVHHKLCLDCLTQKWPQYRELVDLEENSKDES